MWHSDHIHTPEEIEVLRELEYDLFMANPGFRSMWADNFQEYFKALFDEEAWKNKQEERFGKMEDNMSLRMIEDPEFAAFMKHESLIDSVLAGDIPFDNAPLDIQAEVKQIEKESAEAAEQVELEKRLGIEPFYNEPWQRDSLVKKAMDWGHELGVETTKLYDKYQEIDLFRIANNIGQVAAKMLDTDEEPEPGYKKETWEWQLDWSDCNLSLKSLRRCIESLERLQKKPAISKKLKVKENLKIAKELQTEIIDRLDGIEQKLLKKS